MENSTLFNADLDTLTYEELCEAATAITHECNAARVGRLNVAAKPHDTLARDAESLVAKCYTRSCAIHERIQARNTSERWQGTGTIPALASNYREIPSHDDVERVTRGLRNTLTVKVDERLVDDWDAFHATYAPAMAELIPERRVLLYRNPHTSEWDMPGIHIHDSESVLENAELAAMLLEDADEITYRHDYTLRLGIGDVRLHKRGDSASKDSYFVGPNIAEELAYWRDIHADTIIDSYVPNMMGYAGGTPPREDFDVTSTDPFMGLHIGSRARKPSWRPVAIDSRDARSAKRDGRRRH